MFFWLGKQWNEPDRHWRLKFTKSFEAFTPKVWSQYCGEYIQNILELTWPNVDYQFPVTQSHTLSERIVYRTALSAVVLLKFD